GVPLEVGLVAFREEGRFVGLGVSGRDGSAEEDCAEEEQQDQERGPGCQGMQGGETPGRQRVRHSVRHPASPPCANAVDKRQCELQVSEKVTENPQGVNLEGYEKGWGFRLRGWSGSRRVTTGPLPVLRGDGLRKWRATLFKGRHD